MSYELECPYCGDIFDEDIEGSKYDDGNLSETECPTCAISFAVDVMTSNALEFMSPTPCLI